MVKVSQDLFDKALHLEEEGQLECAFEVWRELASTSATRNVFLRYGGAAKELGLLDEAQEAFRRALEIDDLSAPALTQLGIIALGRHDYNTAEGYLRRACAAEEDAGRFT